MHGWTVALLGLLLAGLAWVVIVLPGWVETNRSAPSAELDLASEPEPTGAPAVSAAPEDGTTTGPPTRPEPTLEPERSPPPPSPAAVERPPARPETAPQERLDVAVPQTTEPPLADGFASAMSDALVHLSDGDLAAARQAVDRAARLRPNDDAIADVRTRIDAAETTLQLDVLRDEARRFEATEDWSGAVARYERALALAPNVRFARDRIEPARERAELTQRLTYHTSNPDRLSSSDVREEAEALLDEARAVPDPGPRHRELVSRLTALIATYRTPVRVVLESDAKTEVSIYHVGRLGAFERHELSLTPGTYTVVGSRRGFRDVRAILVVEAGRGPARLTVLCDEEIGP